MQEDNIKNERRSEAGRNARDEAAVNLPRSTLILKPLPGARPLVWNQQDNKNLSSIHCIFDSTRNRSTKRIDAKTLKDLWSCSPSGCRTLGSTIIKQFKYCLFDTELPTSSQLAPAGKSDAVIFLTVMCTPVLTNDIGAQILLDVSVTLHDLLD